MVDKILGSDEVQILIGELEQKRTVGRRGYGVRALLGACFVKSLYRFATWRETADLIREHQALQDVLGGAPSEWACYRFFSKLLKNRRLVEDCIGQILPALREQRPEFGRNVALDSSDLPAYANGQRYKYHGGPEREAFSDLDAGWGHRSAVSTRKGGGYYGFKFNMISCSATDLPLAWVVTSASKADMRVAEAVLDRLPFAPETCSMDKGYDYKAVYEACERRGVEAVVAKRRNSGTGEGPIDRNSDRFKRLYRARSAVEREFGRLKHRYGLTPLRIRGLARVQMHADLCVITRLTTALAQGERQR